MTPFKNQTFSETAAPLSMPPARAMPSQHPMATTGSSVLQLKRDIGVDTKLDDFLVLDDAFHVLDVNRLDVSDGFHGILDGSLSRVLPAFLGLRQDFDHLVDGHRSHPPH